MMALSSSNLTLNESPVPVGITTSGLDQYPARFSQKFISGKVIRLQAHVYVFVCSHCDAEFRSPNSFLQHCEMHYLSTQMTMPYFPPNYPLNSQPEQILPPSNRVSSGFDTAMIPSLPSLPLFNSYNNSSPYLEQSRRCPQFNSMAYSNQSSIAPRQANSSGSSWFECCSPIGGAQAQSPQYALENSVIDHQRQMQPMEEQPDLVGMGDMAVAEVPDDDIYEIYDLGFDVTSAVTNSAKPKRKKRPKSKMGPYICKFCLKPYTRLASLTRHYNSVHEQTSNESRPKSTA